MALLKQLRYDNNDDVSSRIGNSIISYKNKPMWSTATGADLQVHLKDMFNQKIYQNIHSSDEDIDVRAMPLGYVNAANGAYYVTRMPCRRTKQGLGTENCIGWSVNGNNRRSISLGRADMQSNPFFRMLHKDYPSLQGAIKDLIDSRKTKSAVAFHPKLAVLEDEIGLIKLDYWYNPVAVFSQKREIFTLSERYAHYEPILKSFNIPVEIAA